MTLFTFLAIRCPSFAQVASKSAGLGTLAHVLDHGAILIQSGKGKKSVIDGIQGVSINHSCTESNMRKLVGRMWEEKGAETDELKVREMGVKRR